VIFCCLGRSDDFHTEKMPDVNVSLLDGDLAWRQHDVGHTDAPVSSRVSPPWVKSHSQISELVTVKLWVASGKMDAT